MSSRDCSGGEDIITIHHGLNTSPRPWQLTVQLPRPIQDVRHKAVALTELTMANSFFNITAALGNTQWSYQWVDGTVVSDSIPDGYYDVADGSLLAYLQSRMLVNGHFLKPTTAGLPNLLYLNIISLPTYYKAALQLLPVPSSLPAGYALPGAGYASPAWQLPSSPTTPQVTLPPPPAPQSSGQPFLAQILGVNAGTYPPAPVGVPYQHNSDYCPQPTPVHCVQILCDAVSNNTNANNNLALLVRNSQSALPGHLRHRAVQPALDSDARLRRADGADADLRGRLGQPAANQRRVLQPDAGGPQRHEHLLSPAPPLRHALASQLEAVAVS